MVATLSAIFREPEPPSSASLRRGRQSALRHFDADWIGHGSGRPFGRLRGGRQPSGHLSGRRGDAAAGIAPGFRSQRTAGDHDQRPNSPRQPLGPHHPRSRLAGAGIRQQRFERYGDAGESLRREQHGDGGRQGADWQRLHPPAQCRRRRRRAHRSGDPDNDMLYVASTADNKIFAIGHALELNADGLRRSRAVPHRKAERERSGLTAGLI